MTFAPARLVPSQVLLPLGGSFANYQSPGELPLKLLPARARKSQPTGGS